MLNTTLDCAIYLLAVINPISKICVLTGLLKEQPLQEVRAAAVRASVVALIILIIFATGGNFILHRMFSVELYSFRIAAGIVLFWIGFKALSRGVFFETGDKQDLEAMSIVPLASPMIAGPAAMTAAISFSVEHGLPVALSAVALAVTANLLIMLCVRTISSLLMRHNIMGALIRITGIIVATIAVQMVLSGAAAWHEVKIRTPQSIEAGAQPLGSSAVPMPKTNHAN